MTYDPNLWWLHMDRDGYGELTGYDILYMLIGQMC